MSKCTAAQAVKAFEYWLGYCEKASSAYSDTRDKSAFEKNKGTNNWTYAGHVCGINGPEGAWCAMQVSLSIYEACGNSKNDAKTVMHGVWPYAACNQLYDAAPANMKGRRGVWTPKPGDVIVFQQNGIRTHTGMVYAVDKTTVYVYEGNSSNMCRSRSYPLTSTYIYGYVRPNYAAASGDEPEPVPVPVEPVNPYGKVVFADIGLHELSKGCAGLEVKTIQRIIFARGIDRSLAVDGEFGPKTKAGVMALQKQLGLAQDGVVGKDTWTAALTMLD